MRRFLRLLTLWLIALALPIQGAAAATAMPAPAGTPSPTMTMPDGTTMDADAMPCHGHSMAKAGGCGACCGPIAAPQAMLSVVPVAVRRHELPRVAVDTASPLFLTGGTDRPPRPVLA